MKRPFRDFLGVPKRVQKEAEALLTAGRRVLFKTWPQAKGLETSKPIPKEEDWVKRLAEEKQFMLSFVSEIESEFLANGEALQTLILKLHATEQESEKLTELTLGQVQNSAIQFAFQLLKKTEDLVLASYEQYEHVFENFEQLQRSLALLPTQHEELMQVLLPLNFITTSFRIEASRHPADVQSVFATLAGEVTRTVNEVRLTLERHFSELAVSERLVASLMADVHQSVDKHRAAMSETLGNSRKHLQQLHSGMAGAGAGVASLQELNKTVSGHVVGLVMAQQCQDIARQKIEHIGQAMDEIATHLNSISTKDAEATLEAKHFSSRTAMIQLEQVRSVFQELNSAAQALTSGVENLRSDAALAIKAAVNVGGSLVASHATDQCKHSIEQTLSIIRQATQITKDILAALEPLQEKFVNCTHQSTELAGDVRYAALNAQIFAIHVPDGATLEVLASRTRSISDETMTQGHKLGTELKRTAETIDNLRQRLADFQQLGVNEQDILSEEAVLAKERLAQLDQLIPSKIKGIVKEQEELTRLVDALLAMIHFPEKVSQASTRSLGFFEELIAWSAAETPTLTAPASHLRKIDSLKSNYTMESERLAHASALEAAQNTVSKNSESPSQTAHTPSETSAQGNNVELF